MVTGLHLPLPNVNFQLIYSRMCTYEHTCSRMHTYAPCMRTCRFWFQPPALAWPWILKSRGMRHEHSVLTHVGIAICEAGLTRPFH